VSAENYNKIRRILFSTANDRKKGFSVSYEWLEKTYKKQLSPQGYAGLLAELKFYEKNKKEFNLTVAGDMGEHADFSGSMGQEVCRFDVTTNLAYKKYQDYEPFFSDGPKYKIVVMDKASNEVSDIVSLAFEQCSCGGYKIPFLLLMGENFNDRGESQWSNDQLVMKICTSCNEYGEASRHTHHFLYSPQEYVSNLPEEMDNNERRSKINQYCLGAYKYFRREFCDELMGVAGHDYKVTAPDGGGYWTFNFQFKNQVVGDFLLDDIDCGLL
tara:strand:+ start:513 stop:1325 length:813 start_codon:yes stop_codon:yes gene_type:complete